jgi:methanogenic corrinoid protein MtbC1
MGPYFTRRGRSKGTVVIGAVAGDHHALPGAMLADLLRDAGYEPDDLGANTPASSFVDATRSADRLVAVLVGATMDDHDASMREVIKALRDAGVRVAILAGGHGVRDEAHARDLGADRWTGRDAAAAVRAVRELSDEKTTG